MGYSRRKEAREIAETIEEANRKIKGITLGQVCSAGIVALNVACYGRQRRGRYRVTGLIDRYEAGMQLSELKTILSKDCLKVAVQSTSIRVAAVFRGRCLK